MTPARFKPGAQGQSVVEYLVLTALLAALLWLPLHVEPFEGRSAAAHLAEVCRTVWQQWTFFYSVP
ncbi:MAG: hypothetical protein V4739_15725 [Pseudomonadota bacterium]